MAMAGKTGASGMEPFLPIFGVSEALRGSCFG